jgi:glyoxylase-like metal-dependent hydrolase (beta-lactamase superfamily II)
MLALEDNVGDIVGKARRGLGLSHGELARRAGCDESTLRSWESGGSTPEDTVLLRLARPLQLEPSRLVEIAHGRWSPEPTPAIVLRNFTQITSSYGGMLVNAYLLWNDATGEAALFDTGRDLDLIRNPIESQSLKLKYLFLTHTHADHVALEEEVRKEWKPAVITSKREFVHRATAVEEGRNFEIGATRVEVLETEGHSPGGLTFVIRFAEPAVPRVAVVGDALFAGSVGGPKFSYERLLRNLRTKALTLPENTVLAPGHGPMTTVGEEKNHNPFFV